MDEPTIKVVLAHLIKRNGVPGTAASIGAATKHGASMVRYALSELQVQGKIRKVQTGAAAAKYYVPTDEQLSKEAKVAAPRVIGPLKIDKHRTELYARIQAERDKYSSVYAELV